MTRYTFAPASLDCFRTQSTRAGISDKDQVVRRCEINPVDWERQEYQWREFQILTEGEFRQLVAENLIREFPTKGALVCE